MVSKKDLFEKLTGRKLGSKESRSYKQISEDGTPYVDIKDPKTGRRFVIPTLRVTQSDYFRRYANLMYMRENTPDLFQKVMDWE